MRNMKKILTVVLCAALLVGCGGQGTPAKGQQPDESKTGKENKEKEKKSLHIRFLSANNGTEPQLQILQTIADNYAKEHPELDFSYEPEYIPDRTSYLQKLKILASSQELPEWFDSDPDSFFGSLVEKGLVYNIGDLLDELGVADKFYDLSKEYVKLPGSDKMYIIPWQANTEYFFYNKDLFKQAGITETPKTMDELMETCKTLKAAGITPISTQAGMWPFLRYFAMIPFRQSGNKYLEDACSGAASWGTELGLENAAYIQELAQYFQTGFATCDYDTMMDLFIGNKAAIMYNGIWALPSLVDESGELRSDLAYFSMPSYKSNDVTGPDDYFAHAGIGTAVRKDAMTQEMKDYLLYLFEHFGDMMIEGRQVSSIIPASTENLPQIYQQILKEVTNVHTYAKCWDVVIDAASLETLIKSSTELCLGTMTPKEWADSLDKAVAENVK